MSQTDIEIRVRLNNDGLRESELEARRAAERIAAAAARAAARAAREAERRRSRERTESHRLAQAREQLGMRSERTIQREIQRTEAAYNRLRASGRLSMSELERAAQRTRQRVAELNNEMGRLTREQKAQRALRIGASVAVGTVAAGAVLKTPIQRAIDYDYRLAHMANTAFSERDSEGRKIGMKELETVINDAVKQGGGTRESAA
ncbi:MAG: hypothetical protein LBF91_02880, partial [Azoarcus sp.]|nr:hypothetical protein [Azoarcus sp.]